jgi:hypothetical protein
MTWPVADAGLVAPTDPIEFDVESPPLWVLMVALLLDVAGIATALLLGLPGAVAGYACALLAFVAVLIFRRLDGVKRQQAVVRYIPGLDNAAIALMLLTIVVMVVSVWPLATEWSRGA